MGQLADLFAGRQNAIDSNAGQSQLNQRRLDFMGTTDRASAPNEAAGRVLQRNLDFHKVGDSKVGLDMSKLAQYGGRHYDSSTPEFAQIKAKEQSDKMRQMSGLGGSTRLNLNERNSSGYAEQAESSQWEKETAGKYRQKLGTPDSMWGLR